MILFTSSRFTLRRLGSLLLSATLSLSPGLGLAGLTAGLLNATAFPAQASLDENLAAFPDDTLALVSVNLDPGHWSYAISRVLKIISAQQKMARSQAPSANPAAAGSAKALAKPQERPPAKPQTPPSVAPDAPPPASEQALPGELSEIMRMLKGDLQFDPFWDGLLNLGSHLTVAYRPQAGSNGDVLFSLNLRSPDKVAGLLERLREHISRSGDYHSMVVDHLGPAEIYTLVYQKGGEGLAGFDTLHLAMSGNNLIGTLGPDTNLIKKMLYIQAVLPADSRFRLSNQPMFAPVKAALQDKALWFFMDTQGALQTATHQQGEATADMQELAILAEVAHLNRGFGAGLDIDSEAIKIKTFIAPDLPNLKPGLANYVKALNQKPQHDLNNLLQQMPSKPVLLAAGQNLDVVLSNPLPFALPLDGLPFTADDVRKGIKAVTNIDFRTDFVPRLDGRFGLGLFEPAQSGQSPQAVLYLGIRDGQEAGFDNLMQKQFQFNLSALQALGNAASDQSPVQQNMLTLKTMVETWSVDHEGLYPPNLAALQADAQAKKYWQDFANPITGKKGLGAAMKDYAGMGSKPDVNLAGTVFYEPLGKAGQTDGYQLYGYDPGGKLYQLADQSNDFKVLLDVLPRANPPKAQPALIQPKQVDSYEGTPIYTLALNLKAQLPADLPTDVQPVYARKGNLWMLAINSTALKAALSGNKPARVDYWLDKTHNPDAAAVFFLDIASSGRLIADVLPQLVTKPEDLQSLQEALKPWHSLFAAASRQPQGTSADFVVDVELDKVRFEDLLELFLKPSASSPLKPQAMAPVTATVLTPETQKLTDNMSFLQTMVEAYGANHQQHFPARLQELEKEARAKGYWVSLSNPWQSKAQALVDKSAYQPGSAFAGRVIYEPVKDKSGQIRNYRIYGADESGELRIESGKVLVLSHPHS